MNDLDILEGNLIIANRLTKPVLKELFYEDFLDSEFESTYLYDLRFHCNWEWLMETVIFIEQSGKEDDEFDIFGNCVQLGDEEFVGKNKKEAIWKAIVWWCENH